MAFVRTDYGLIYNTDGSLCATLLPEGGVAVTEGTTNQIFVAGYQSWFTNLNVGDSTDRSVGGGTIRVTRLGEHRYRAEVIADCTYPILSLTNTFTWPANQPHTMSAYILDYYEAPGTTGRLGLGRSSSGFPSLHGADGLGRKTYTHQNTTDINAGFAVRATSTGLIKAGTYIEWEFAQVELNKPYATSFVEGTRPAGRLTYNLPTNLNADFTIRLKCFTEHDKHTSPAFLLDDDNHRLYLYKTESTYELRAVDNSENTRDIIYTPDSILGKHDFTIIRTGNVLSFYANGNLVGEMEYEWNPFSSKIWIGSRSGGTYHGNGTSFYNLLILPYAVSPETNKTWHSLDAQFFDPREILDPAAKPIQVQGSGGYMVIDKHGEKWVRNSDGKTVFQFDVNTGNAEYGGELSAKVITANMFREIRNVLPYTHLDSLDESNPIEFRFYIPTETIQIVSIKLNVYGERFRGYTKSAKVGGTATSETWKYEGGGRTEPGGEHTHTLETSLEQTSSRSHTIVVEGSTGTAGEHQHASAGEHQHIIDTSSSETSIYGSLGGSTPERHSHSYNRVTGMRKAEKHTHPGTGNHSHSINISLGNDTHSHGYRKVNAIRDVSPHTHQFYLPEHKHNIAGHSHELEFGIYQDTTPNQCRLYCNNGSGYGDAIVLNNAPDTTTPYSLCNELDLTSKFSGTGWKSIKFTSTRRGRINFQLVVKVDLEA